MNAHSIMYYSYTRNDVILQHYFVEIGDLNVQTHLLPCVSTFPTLGYIASMFFFYRKPVKLVYFGEQFQSSYYVFQL